MAGGAGPSFWPLSREGRPMQFLNAVKGKSFLRTTYERYLELVPRENIFIVTLSRYRDLVFDDIPDLPAGNLILEPYGRNTAPCIAYATYTILKRDPEAVMVVGPADNLVPVHEAWKRTLNEALNYADTHEALITLGIVPDKPDTNFGYIQVAGGAKAYEQEKPVKIKTFTEKPDEDLARVFVESGEFLWNSGIFVWKASVIRQELEHHIPAVTDLFRNWEQFIGTSEEQHFIERAYMNMDRISIDYAVMEKTAKGWVYPADFQWASVGNWESAYHHIGNPDSDGNATYGGRHLLMDCKDDIIVTTDKGKLIAISGLEDYMVIDNRNVLMICPRDDKRIKDITSHIGLPYYEDYR